jgi:hypothetical protein
MAKPAVKNVYTEVVTESGTIYVVQTTSFYDRGLEEYANSSYLVFGDNGRFFEGTAKPDLSVGMNLSGTNGTKRIRTSKIVSKKRISQKRFDEIAFPS